MLIYNSARDDPRVVAEGAALARNGYRVSVIGAALQPDQPPRAAFRQMDLWITPVAGGWNPYLWLRALWRWLQGDLHDLGAGCRRSGWFALIYFNLWCMRLGLKLKPDIVHCHEHQPIFAARWLARRLRIPVIYDAHESVPDTVPGLKGWIAQRLETAIIRQTGATVITVGDRLAAALRARGARRVEVVGSWKPLEDFSVSPHRLDDERRRLGLEPFRLVVSYLGALQPDRLLVSLLEAVELDPEVALLISGRGPLRETIMTAAECNPQIRWLNWVPMADLPLYTGLSDVIYYCLRESDDRGNNYYSAPNKLFEALAAGKPVIARRGVGEIGDILERTGAGLLLDEVTPETLRAAFAQLQQPAVRDRLAAAARAAREQYNWAAAEARLLAVYAELVGPP